MKKILRILTFVYAMAFLSVDCYGVNGPLNQSVDLILCYLTDGCGLLQNENILLLINKAQQDLLNTDFENLEQHIVRVQSSNKSYLMFFKKQETIVAMMFIDCENNPVELIYFYKNPMFSDQDSREMRNVTIEFLRHSGRIQ